METVNLLTSFRKYDFKQDSFNFRFKKVITMMLVYEG